MCAKLTFDANKVAPQKPMDPVPKGWYPVIITESAIEPTASDPKDGRRLSLGVEIIDGEFKGRKAWDGLNIKNKNATAQRIGEEQLSAICHATGVFKLTDTAELHNKPFEIKLGYEDERRSEDGKSTYEARNVFKGFRALEGNAPAAAASVAPAAAAPAWAKGGGKTPGKPAPAEQPPADETPATPGGVNAERPFYVYLNDDNQEMTGADIANGLGDGTIPADTPVMAQDEPEGTDWKTAADYEIEPFTPEPPPPPTKPAAPTKPGKPAAPAAPAAKGGVPPWKQGKR